MEDDISEASTPSSLASTPRECSGLCPRSGNAATQQGAAAAAAAAALMEGLRVQARDVRADTAGMHGVLQLLRGHLAALQQQLGELQAEAALQRRMADDRLMEKECELQLTLSEAASYKLAARIRAAAVATLQA
jgi:hypothetical protein